MNSDIDDPNADKWVQEQVAVSFDHSIMVHPEEFHVDSPPAAVGSEVGRETHSGSSMLISFDMFGAPEVPMIVVGSKKYVVEMTMMIGSHSSISITSMGSVLLLIRCCRINPFRSLREITCSDASYRLTDTIS